MDSKITKSLLRIISLAAQHSERFRLVKLDLEALPEDVLCSVSSDMLDLLETRAEAWRHSAASPSGVLPSAGGQRTKRRPCHDMHQ